MLEWLGIVMAGQIRSTSPDYRVLHGIIIREKKMQKYQNVDTIIAK